MSSRLNESRDSDLVEMYKNGRRASTRRGRVIGSARAASLHNPNELIADADAQRDEAIEQLLDIFETNTQQTDKQH